MSRGPRRKRTSIPAWSRFNRKYSLVTSLVRPRLRRFPLSTAQALFYLTPVLKLYLLRVCCAAILLTASVVSAANVVPGLDIVVAKGSAVVFHGVTDGKGRFETGPLDPGVYTIEVRTAPNTPPSSARFFLSLGGAKPLGEATMRPGVALAMNATVRNPAGIRGQVSARGGIVYVRSSALANAEPRSNPSPPPNTSPLRPTSQFTPAPPPPSNRPVAPNPSVASGGNQAAARALPASSPTAAVVGPESPLVRRPPGYQPKIINGRRYFWTPIAAGSNLGRWLPESVARPVGAEPAKTNPPPTKASPTPSRTRR